jgi:hypothetical protein
MKNSETLIIIAATFSIFVALPLGIFMYEGSGSKHSNKSRKGANIFIRESDYNPYLGERDSDADSISPQDRKMSISSIDSDITDNESDYEKKNVGGRKTKRNKHKKNKTRKK